MLLCDTNWVCGAVTSYRLSKCDNTSHSPLLDEVWLTLSFNSARAGMCSDWIDELRTGWELAGTKKPGSVRLPGEKGVRIRNGESVSSDSFQINLQYWLFRSVFLWLNFTLLFVWDPFWSFAFLSFNFSLISIHHNSLSLLFLSYISLLYHFPHLLASSHSLSYFPLHFLLLFHRLHLSVPFFLFMSVFRYQRDMALQPTVTLVRFVVWPLVMEELRPSGLPAVQKAPPDEHCTHHPPQESSRMVSRTAPL